MPIYDIWTTTVARQMMTFTRVERARITDSVLNIQSASASLEDIDEGKVAELVEIQKCLKNADKTLRSALRHTPNKPS
jgi:hypothetical protein